MQQKYCAIIYETLSTIVFFLLHLNKTEFIFSCYLKTAAHFAVFVEKVFSSTNNKKKTRISYSYDIPAIWY